MKAANKCGPLLVPADTLAPAPLYALYGLQAICAASVCSLGHERG